MDWVVALLVGVAAGGSGVYLYLKSTSNKTLLKARSTADAIVADARQEAEQLKKELLIEAESEAFDQKQQVERDLDRRRAQLNDLEARLDTREMDIDRKAEVVNKKESELLQLEEDLARKEERVTAKTDELNRLIIDQIQKLEEISGLTREEAKHLLLKDLEEEATEEGERLAQHIVENARVEAARKAREIVVQAIQQVAGEQSVEATISVITLPNDDMKGRIIGREGRNIRAFEMVTGVDVIIDDTPEIVVLSSYNSYRREIARRCLEKLISDGRIHPARIEEVYEKTSEEMRESLREIGEEALLEAGVHGVPTEVAEVLGRLKYRTAYGQNILAHCMEVTHLTGIMAAELGLDVKMAKRAAILHDIGKGLDNYTENNHAVLGADFLRKHKEPPVVVNAAETHHDEEKAISPITVLVAAADRISGSRPGARRESLESFIKRMEQLEAIAMRIAGVSACHAIQAGREIRVMVETDEVDDGHARHFARDIARAVQSEIEFPGQIKVTVIREYRTQSIAT